MSKDYLLNYFDEGATVTIEGQVVTVAKIYMQAASHRGQYVARDNLAVLSTEGKFFDEVKVYPLAFPNSVNAPDVGTWVEVDTPIDGKMNVIVTNHWGRKLASDENVVPCMAGHSYGYSTLYYVPFEYDPKQVRVLTPKESQKAAAAFQEAYESAYKEELKKAFEKTTGRGMPGLFASVRAETKKQMSHLDALVEDSRKEELNPVMCFPARKITAEMRSELGLISMDADKTGYDDMDGRIYTIGAMEKILHHRKPAVA